MNPAAASAETAMPVTSQGPISPLIPGDEEREAKQGEDDLAQELSARIMPYGLAGRWAIGARTGAAASSCSGKSALQAQAQAHRRQRQGQVLGARRSWRAG